MFVMGPKAVGRVRGLMAGFGTSMFVMGPKVHFNILD